MPSTYTLSPWLTCFEIRPQATVRLFCIPHGGGGAQNFKEWAESLPDFIEVLALSYPGRGSRHGEPAIHCMSQLADEILTAMTPYLDKPYALFGHSVGALVAYEVTCRIQAAKLKLPMRLIVSAHDIPEKSHSDTPMYQLSDTDLLNKISELGLVPEEALKNRELVNFILPPLRADFEVSETYQWKNNNILMVPITATIGDKDTLLNQADMKDWSKHTNSKFTFRVYEGDHFYTVSKVSQLLTDMAKELEIDVKKQPLSIMIGETRQYPNQCLHELFREQAKLYPNRIAVSDIKESLSFQELDEQTDLLARELQHRGVVVDSMVSIFMESSVAYVVAYLAILKAGGAYMPLEIAYPTELLQKTLHKTSPIAILTTSDYAAQLPKQWLDSGDVFCLDNDWILSLMAKVKDKILPELDEDRVLPTLNSLAYCVMSSGTTGKPKGIICPHRGAVNSYYWRYHNHPYEEGEREASNVFFVWEVIRPLLQGYPAYIIPDNVIYDPLQLVDYLEKNEITRVLFTPSLLEQILNTPELALNKRLSKLKIVWLNGEVVPTTLCQRFFEALPNVKLLNDYSISETHDVCTHDLKTLKHIYSPKFASLGQPMSNVRIYLLDNNLQPVPQGVAAEVYVAGDSLARGYLGDPEKTAERFIPEVFQPSKNNNTITHHTGDNTSPKDNDSIMFRTGDMGRILPNGELEITGRVEFMIKLRGYTIVLGAIEAAINAHEGVSSSAVITKDNEKTNQPESLVAYVISNGILNDEALIISLRHYLKDHLPQYAIPTYFMLIQELPLHAVTGKLDRGKLPDPINDYVSINIKHHNDAVMTMASPTEKIILQAWEKGLGVRPNAITDNFFDLGGHSLLAIQVCRLISQNLGMTVSVIDIFTNPTIQSLAAALDLKIADDNSESDSKSNSNINNIKTSVASDSKKSQNMSSELAIVGMAARFPNADNIDEFWSNLRDGVCSIRELTDEELEKNGVPKSVYTDENYRKVGAIIDNVDYFDPQFWQLSKKEAEIMDPQHRLFLETCWHALEHAGYAPNQNGQRTGVFGGCYSPLYLLHNLAGGGFMDATDPISYHMTETGNDKDYLTTRVSYLLNLQGPSIAVQSSCSTALSVVASACESLQTGHCDVALAGASSITFPQAGYQYVEGHINSKDGKIRTFDSRASGTILGDGVGVVVLKRLEDAIQAGDTIYSVIKGYATNNDGNHKTGYSAPSVNGQKTVVTSALKSANVSADSISYIEAHGTGTLIGDPIETKALTDVFRCDSQKKQFCAIGSVKPNIGHSNIAAGMASLMKATLSLYHKQIPPTLHYELPNPLIDIENSPFYVNKKLIPWESEDDKPRRAGVTCLGIGGTNNHFILEEAPFPQMENECLTKQNSVRNHHLLVVSGKTPEALQRNQQNLARFLHKYPKLNIKDIEFTLQEGRCHFDYRSAVSCVNVDEAITNLHQVSQCLLAPLSKPLINKITNQQEIPSAIKTVFLFPGQGSQHHKMGFELYQNDPVFKQYFDDCCELLEPLLNIDIRDLLFAESDTAASEEAFKYAYHTQPIIVAHQIAMARTLMTWGIKPDAVAGHSIGEYTAAYIAGIFSLEDTLKLIVARGQAMERAGEGRMLSVTMTEYEARQWLTKYPDISLGVINTPERVVLSGPIQAIDTIQQALNEQEISTQTVNVRQAFHSSMMEDASKALIDAVKPLKRHLPNIPLMSNVSGTWMTNAQIHDDNYWAEHMRGTVNFSSNIRELLTQSPNIIIEAGASTILTQSLRVFTEDMPIEARPLVTPCARHPKDTSISDTKALDRAISQLWIAGYPIDWSAFRNEESKNDINGLSTTLDFTAARRIGLPGYAFEPQSCWVDSINGNGALTKNSQTYTMTNDGNTMIEDIGHRGFIPSWSRTAFPIFNSNLATQRWLVICSDGLQDICTVNQYLINELRKAHAEVQVVNPVKLALNSAAAYANYFNQLHYQGQFPNRILYLDNLTTHNHLADYHIDLINKEHVDLKTELNKDLETLLDSTYYPTLYFAQGLATQKCLDPVSVWVITNDTFQVGEEYLNPIKSTLLGATIVLPQEYPQISCRTIDICSQAVNDSDMMRRLLNEISVADVDTDPFVALRGAKRWVKRYENAYIPPVVQQTDTQKQPPFKMGGTYLITGGLGRIARSLCQHLAGFNANLILTTTRNFPIKSQWKDITHLDTDDDNFDHQIIETIQHLQTLEQSGATIKVVCTKLYELEDVETLIDDIMTDFGALDGVFHLAGLADLRYLPDIDKQISSKEFEPKIYGLINLSNALKRGIDVHNITPDFVMLFSSLASILGGYSMTAYTAANRFMDAYVQSNPWRQGIRWFCVNWDDWDYDYSKEQTTAYEQTVAQFAMPIEDGITTIERLLNMPEPQQWIISTRPLLPRVEKWLHQENQNNAHQPVLTDTTVNSQPNDLLSRILETYRDVLSTASYQAEDSFFAAGGDSLLASQILLKLRRDLGEGGKQLTLAHIFDFPSPQSLFDSLQNVTE